jgi:peptide/nickel transport system substrate-binding protein
MLRCVRGTMQGVRALVLTVGLLAACAAPVPEPTPSLPPLGGTLRVGWVDSDEDLIRPYDYYDPAHVAVVGLGRCCLARTLLATDGRSAAEGGSILYPDLAREYPTISADGRTWTFRLRPDVRYSPPHQDAVVVSADLVRSIERSVRLTPEIGLVPLAIVEGAQQFAEGDASTIRGIEAPAPDTIVFRLTEPYGGFGFTVSDPAMTPIPEGASEGHDEDYATWFVSTGPYMFEGSPPYGEPGSGTLTLVRNPSWDRDRDPLRGAWVDRIEMRPAGEVDAARAAVEAGSIDLLDIRASAEEITRFQSDPALRSRTRVIPIESLAWVPMNVALPPFDDIQVRRAMNLSLDRAELMARLLVGEAQGTNLGVTPSGTVARHIFPDSMTGGLLLNYAPFATPGDHGDVARARAEMARSGYDEDADGLCDSSVCGDVRVSAVDPDAAAVVIDALAQIGISASMVETNDQFDIALPPTQAPIQVNPYRWFAPNDTEMAVLLQGKNLVADEFTVNQSLVGAAPELLSAWGYPITDVPSLDDKIDACNASVGSLRSRCWAELDQLATEQVVPWVPIYTLQTGWIFSPRVREAALTQSIFSAAPSLDRIALSPGAP